MAACVATTAAHAAPWGTDYQMGTFVAYGGSNEQGRISLECGDASAEGLAAGVMFFSITPKAGVKAGKLDDVTQLALRVDDAGWLPLAVARDGDAFIPDGDLDLSTRTSLLRMLEVGEVLTIRTADAAAMVIGEIDLDGSSEALGGFEDCAQEAM